MQHKNIESFSPLTARRILKIEEAVCHGFYLCPAGKLTCGVGHNVEARPIKMALFHKWLKHGMTHDEVEQLLARDMFALINSMNTRYSHEQWFQNFTSTQRLGWLVMAFQLGLSGQYWFKNSINLLRQGVTGQALQDELLDSEWHRQTPERAARITNAIAHSKIDDYYYHTEPAIIPAIKIH